MDDAIFRISLAELEFKLRLQTNVRIQQQSYDGLGESHNIVSPLQMAQAAADSVKEAAKIGDDDAFAEGMESYVLYRLFYLLGIKAVPPTIIDGEPSAEDFQHPEHVAVLKIDEY